MRHRCQTFTPRNLEALSLLSTGRTAESIAFAMGISVSAVEKHLRCTYRLLGVDNRISAVVEGLRRGVIEFPPINKAG